jgi:hypothetical protein
MAGYGKGAATSYSDFYSKNSDTPNTNDNPDLSTNPPKDSPSEVVRRRRAALQRRLKNLNNLEKPRKTMRAN